MLSSLHPLLLRGCCCTHWGGEEEEVAVDRCREFEEVTAAAFPPSPATLEWGEKVVEPVSSVVAWEDGGRERVRFEAEAEAGLTQAGTPHGQHWTSLESLSCCCCLPIFAPIPFPPPPVGVGRAPSPGAVPRRRITVAPAHVDDDGFPLSVRDDGDEVFAGGWEELGTTFLAATVALGGRWGGEGRRGEECCFLWRLGTSMLS